MFARELKGFSHFLFRKFGACRYEGNFDIEMIFLKGGIEF